MKKISVVLLSFTFCVCAVYALPVLKPLSHIGSAISAYLGNENSKADKTSFEEVDSKRLLAPQTTYLSQDFSSSSVVSTYVNLTSPTNGQFNSIGTSGSGVTISISNGALQYVRDASNAGSYTRSTDLSPTPATLKYSLDLSVSGNFFSGTNVAVFQVGSNYSPTLNNAETNANTYARFGLNFVNVDGQFSLRNIEAGANSPAFSGSQKVTWFLNNSGSAITYLAPDGSQESLDNDKGDLWVGTSRIFNDYSVLTATQTMTDLKFAFTGGTGTTSIKIDNILVEDIPPIVANTAPSVPASTIGGPVGTAFYDFDVDSIYSDVDGDTLASITDLSVVGGPAGGSSAAVLAGNVIRFTPGNPSLATPSGNPYVVTYRVTDSAGSFTDTSLTIRIFDPPNVTTNAATSVTDTSATLNGSATSGLIVSETTGFFRFGTVDASCDGNYGTRAPASGGTVFAGGAGPFSESLTGLTPGTTYFFCAIATNSGGTTIGVRQSFTTGSIPKYRSRQSGNWNDFNTWEIDTGGGFVPAVSGQTPTSVDGTISIRSPHSVNVTASVITDQTTVEAGGTLTSNSGTVLTIADGSGDDLTNNGTINAAATIKLQGTFANNSAVSLGALIIDNGAAFTGSGSFAYTGGAVIAFQNTDSVFNVDAPANYWPDTNGPANFQILTATSVVSLNVSRTVGAQVFLAGGLQNAQNLTSTGELRIIRNGTGGGSVSGSPTYGVGSVLSYVIISGDYARSDEWLPNVTSGPGYPHDVSISFGSLDLPNGSTAQPFQIGGSLGIGSGAALSMGSMTEPLRVLGSINNSGTLDLSNADGGDLYVGGDWNNSGDFFHNSRLVAFNGTGPQAINDGADFARLAITTTTARTVTFEAGTSYLAIGSMTFTGAPGNLLTLRSSSPGTQWGLSAPIPANQTVEYVDVQDSNASFGNVISPTNSVDSGNNLNWNFGAPPAPGEFNFDPVGYSPNESDGTATITVTRTGGTDGAVSVDYGVVSSTLTKLGVVATATGGASCAEGSGVDFVAPSGTLNFADGESSKTFDLTVCDDGLFEPTEGLNLSLSNAAGGATIGSSGTAFVNILDNDTQPSLQFSASNFDVNENAGTATVTVTRTGAAEHALSVNYAANVGGTATEGTCGAFSGNDFVGTSGTLNFAAGDNEESFTITICNDGLFEASNETILIALNTQSSPALLGTPNEGTVTIIPNNDPPTVEFSAATSNIGEGAGTKTFTVNRTGAVENSFSVNFATSDGTAVSGSCGSGGDYLSSLGSVSFVGGDPNKTFDVTICDDADSEGNETFSATLSNPTGGAVIGTNASETVAIVDNEPRTLVVDRLDDSVTADECTAAPNDCSLRRAIGTSNDGDTITFDPALFAPPFAPEASPAAAVITLSGTEIPITTDITITGPGASQLTIDADGLSRIYNVATGADVDMSGMTLTGGFTNDPSNGGGAIIVNTGANLTLTGMTLSGNSSNPAGGGSLLNLGTATIGSSTFSNNTSASTGGAIYSGLGSAMSITNSVISNNSAGSWGGGILTEVPITISGSTVSGNTAGTQGGGIRVVSANTVTIENSSISGNSAGEGGGVWSNYIVNLTNTTASGNTASASGGGVKASGVNVTGSTFTDNCVGTRTGGICTPAGQGGAIETTGDILRVRNSTFSNNAATTGGGIYYLWAGPNESVISSTFVHSTITVNGVGLGGSLSVYNTIVSVGGCSGELGGSVTDGGFNLDSGNTCGFTAPTSKINTDPLLGPLQDNGGPTFTHAFNLSLGLSPAIDAGSAFGLTTDQRGELRTQDFPAILNTTGGDGTDIGAFEQGLLAPTAAPASISGRVMAANGVGIRGAVVMVQGPDGVTRSTTTNSLGHYEIEGLTVGATYLVSVNSRRYSFPNGTQLVNLEDSVSGLDFTASQ